MREQGVTGMLKKTAVLLVALLAAACGSQAGNPTKTEQGLGHASAPAAAAPGAAAQPAPEDRPVTSAEGTPTTVGDAVNQTSAAAGGAAGTAPGQKTTASSGPAAAAARAAAGNSAAPAAGPGAAAAHASRRPAPSRGRARAGGAGD